MYSVIFRPGSRAWAEEAVSARPAPRTAARQNPAPRMSPRCFGFTVGVNSSRDPSLWKMPGHRSDGRVLRSLLRDTARHVPPRVLRCRSMKRRSSVAEDRAGGALGCAGLLAGMAVLVVFLGYHNHQHFL